MNLSDPSEVHPLPLWGAMVGRSRYAEIVIENLEVSRQHAQLTYEEGKVLIEDLESTNGTLLNGKKVNHSEMRDGDRFTVGDTTYVLKRDKIGE